MFRTSIRPVGLLALLLALGLSACAPKDDEAPPAATTFEVRVESRSFHYADSGVFGSGPALPGGSQSFTFAAVPGDKLSFVTMYGQSNDLFFAPDEAGIALFDVSDNPIVGDVTSQVMLWDAGTEVNEEPGVGPNQAPRQSGPNTGPDEDGPVQPIASVGDGFTYPAVSSVLTATLSHDAATGLFTLTLDVDAASPTPIAPGVFVVHTHDAPLFTSGQPDRGLGLEAAAEDGNPATLGAAVAARTFSTPSDADVFGAGPAAPGGSYSFSFAAMPGDRLSFATMYVESNDLFYAPDDTGIALFDATDMPVTGDVTSQVMLWDAGTEVNQQPGTGSDQPLRQPGPNTGADENGTVRPVADVGDGFSYPAVSSVLAATLSHDAGTGLFTLTIDVDPASPTPLAPGVFAVHRHARPLFARNLPDRGQGLEALAEDGAAAGLGDYLARRAFAAPVDSGVFDTPVTAGAPGPATPGDSFEFSFTAVPGDRLSFETMYGQSNDLFFAPAEQGVALYDATMTPVTGDITGQIVLWDAGTEVNQEPGVGPDQAPRQSGPNTGADENGTVRAIADVSDGFTYPAVADVLSVSLAESAGTFTVTIAVDPASPTPIAPGVFVVHRNLRPLFAAGLPDRGQGLEAAAEDGYPAQLSHGVRTDIAGFATPLAPGMWALHRTADPLFTAGEPDRGLGLESLAEDGDPSALNASLDSRAGVRAHGVFNVTRNTGAAGPAAAYDAFVFQVSALPGEKLSFGSMFGQSNDLFYAPPGAGIALFDIAARPVSGDVTAQVGLWDAGTEVNEEPGVGPNQAPRQGAPNTGPDENGTVRSIGDVRDGYAYPMDSDVIRVVVTPQ